MPRDVDFHAFALAFPEAVLALAGVRARGHRAASIAAKEQSRELDLVFRSPRRREPLVYCEVQDAGDPDVERSALIKLAVVCAQEDRWDAVIPVILYSSHLASGASSRAP